jgi:acetyltransferase-like isoleucine patch superfamily enzyme
LAFAAAIALLPSFLKIPIYRWLYGYEIGKGVRIGCSPFVGVGRCRIGDGVQIGSFNLFYQVKELEIGAQTQIGFLNLFRGGQAIRIGQYATILRQNVFNSIINPDPVNPATPVLELGAGAVVASGHWLDFTDQLTIGDHSIVGGRNSSFWTHNRQRVRPITIGPHCYLGSEIRVAPGVEVSPYCIVALGAVLSGSFTSSRVLIGGNPASVVRELAERDVFLITRKTRNDIPDELTAELPLAAEDPRRSQATVNTELA